MPVTAAFQLQMQFSGSAGAWTDVWSDVRQTTPVRGEYGIRGNSPTDRTASTGTLSFGLDNSEKNSAGLLGYYSPGHANARSGFELGIGCRLAITYSGSTFYKWRGTLSEILPMPGKRGQRVTLCTATDWFDEAHREKTRALATALDVRGNEIIDLAVSAMARKPAASSLETGQSIFPFGFDNQPDETTTVARVLQSVAQSELGFVFLRGNTTAGGELVFQNRHTRPLAGSALATLDEDMVEMVPRRSRNAVYNHVRAIVHPRVTDSSACVLFDLRSVPFIGAGKSIGFGAFYRDRTTASNPLPRRIGAYTACDLVLNTDYLFNSASDGTGTDLGANLTVGASFGANSTRIDLTNGGGTGGFVTRLRIRGRGLYDYEPVELESVDTDSTAAYGDNVLTYDMPLQNDAGTGQDVADYLRQLWKDPLTRIESVRFIGNNSDALMLAGLQREPSDRIALSEGVTGLDRDWFIQGIGFEISDRGLIEFRWILTPTDPFAVWALGVTGSGELGETTVLGF